MTDEQLMFLNTRLQTGDNTACANASPNAVWIANTNNIVDEMNKEQFNLRQHDNFSV